MLKIIIRTLGKPIAKKRPRFVHRNGFSKAYNCQETEEGRWLLEVLQQIPKERPVFEKGAALHMTCICHFERPKSHFGTGRNASILKQSAPEYHVQSPDTTNICKFYEDILNGILWADDCQIVHTEISKGWSSVPMVEIIVTEIEKRS